MIQLGSTTSFKRQVLSWDGNVVPMKEPEILPGQTHLTNGEMREVVMQAEEPAKTKEATDTMVKYWKVPMIKWTLEKFHQMPLR